MSHGPYQLLTTAGGGTVARVRARGNAVLSAPLLNRGTAFTVPERRRLGLSGLLPTGVSTMEGQLQRAYAQYLRQPDDLAKNVYLANLRQRNEVLFYRLFSEHLQDMLPIVYTPTVGEAIQRFSHEYRRPRGVYLSVNAPQEAEQSFRNYGLGAEDVDLIVATDAEGILGIGDWGVGGIEISIGKLAVYTAAAGIHPRRIIPVVLDMGTDNQTLLTDQMYLGNRHPRVRGERYDQLIDAYVTAAGALFPHAMLHWEDFGTGNARRVLTRYADSRASFNDDLQGTAAVVLAALFSALTVSGTRMRDQRVVIHGAGTAGLGIADMIRDVMISEGLTPAEATRRIYPLDRCGLLLDNNPQLHDFQQPYAHPATDVAAWATDGEAISLADVVTHAHPTILIGTSTQAGAFTEPIVRRMAADIERPIIMPLSNPTSKAEAVPADIIAWTDGRALVATGSPFPPVEHRGQRHHIAQANNALVFPGLGLGVTVTRATRVSNRMLSAAADAIAHLTDTTQAGAPLLPTMQNLRTVSTAVATAVALAAQTDGLNQIPIHEPTRQIQQAMWQPEYPTIEPI